MNDSDPSGLIKLSTIGLILDIILFAVSFSPWGLFWRIVICSIYVLRIGIALVQLLKANKRFVRWCQKWVNAVLNAAYSFITCVMGIVATILGLPRITMRLKDIGIAMYRICQVFGIALSGAGLAITWASKAGKPAYFRR